MNFRQRRRDKKLLKRAAKGRYARDQFLLKMTWYDSTWWVLHLQRRISDTFTESEDPNHPNCDPELAFGRLMDEIVHFVMETDAPPRPYDGNMRVGAVAAIILTCWTARIAHAKCYDPNRPVWLRRASLASHANLVKLLVESATDEQLDDDYFPTQGWNPPYGKTAMGGDFV